MEKDKSQMLFMNLIMMLHALAWQQMGKMKNPLTDMVEVDLEGARNFIDSLEVLQQKSAGNLSPEEDRLLNEILRELRLNYIDEVHKHEKEPHAGNISEQESGNLSQ